MYGVGLNKSGVGNGFGKGKTLLCNGGILNEGVNSMDVGSGTGGWLFVLFSLADSRLSENLDKMGTSHSKKILLL